MTGRRCHTANCCVERSLRPGVDYLVGDAVIDLVSTIDWPLDEVSTDGFNLPIGMVGVAHSRELFSM